MNNEVIQGLIKKVNDSVEKYNNMFEDEEVMANDVLDYARVVMRSQDRLITALLNSDRNKTKFLEDIEQFEADLIMCNDAWNTLDGLPKIPKEFYNRWIELQSLRNKLLGNELGKAKTYGEITKE